MMSKNLLFLLFLWGGAAAQNYPAKPINFVLPFPPGAPDMAARVNAFYLFLPVG